MIDLSIAIVTYNNSEEIRETITSVLNAIPHEYSYKLYIIDNASQDSTVEITKSIIDTNDIGIDGIIANPQSTRSK